MIDPHRWVASVVPSAVLYSVPGFVRRLVPPAAARRFSILIWLAAAGATAAIAVCSMLTPALGEEPGAMRYLAYAAFLGRTFVFHMGLGVVLLALAAAVLGRGRQAMAVGALGVVLIALLGGFARGRGGGGHDPAAPTLTVMSLNLLASNGDVDAVLAAIAAEDPDVLLLQEYTERWHAAIYPYLAMRFPEYAQFARPDAYGQAVYSKHRFTGPAVRSPLADVHPTPQMIVRIEHAGREVAIRNIHLLSPATPSLMLEGYHEAQRLAEQCAASDVPLIAMGDFNATPNSAHASLLRRAGMIDTHAAAGVGRGATWPRLGVFRFAPGVRIDQAFASAELAVVASRLGAETGSDHLPIIAEFAWAEPRAEGPRPRDRRGE